MNTEEIYADERFIRLWINHIDNLDDAKKLLHFCADAIEVLIEGQQPPSLADLHRRMGYKL